MLAVVLTQFAAGWPHVETVQVPGAARFVTRVDDTTFVLDSQGNEVALGAQLRACLASVPAPRPGLVELVGGRGVAVDGLCVVTPSAVRRLDELGLPVSWWEYGWWSRRPTAQELAHLARVRSSPAFLDVRRRLMSTMREGAVEVPGCGCSLVDGLIGPVVRRDGGFSEADTLALWRALKLTPPLEGVTVEQADAGVVLHHRGSTMAGTCPVGDDYDDVVRVRWNQARRAFVTMAFPAEPFVQTAPYQRHSALDFSPLDPLDGGVTFALSSGSVMIEGAEPNGAWALVVDGGVDVAGTRRLHAVIRQACVDWPVPWEATARFEFRVDATSYLTRCGGYLVGCELTLDSALRVLPQPEPLERCLRGEDWSGSRADLERSCASSWPDAGTVELTLALTLRDAGQEDASLPHLELALAKGGLSAKDRALALELLRDH